MRAARSRRHWTQAELGRRVGLSQSAVSRLELGLGSSLSVLVWERVAMTLELPLRLELGRDPLERPADAGHLDMQELILRLGRRCGRTRRLELPNRAADPTRWTDVGLCDDPRRCLILAECVNVLDNFGAALRSSDRKLADAQALAVAIGHGVSYSVHQCWIVRATRRNRALVARYRGIFAARFPGSFQAWARALSSGSAPPTGPGLVWCDAAATKVFAWRQLGRSAADDRAV